VVAPRASAASRAQVFAAVVIQSAHWPQSQRGTNLGVGSEQVL